MTVSRRAMFRTVLHGVCAAFAAGRSPSLLQAGEAETRGSQTGPLIVRVSRPFDAETPVQEFASWLTPLDRFFVRSHFGPPDAAAVGPASWRLTVKGLVDRELGLSLPDLRKLSAVTVTAVLQCSGNGRALHQPRVPGVQWERGAVGNAEWTGVRLRDVLRRAGVGERTRHVQLLGADRPALPTVPLFIRSIPLEKAMHPDTILAYEMNGRPLPLLHGAPLRVITPGWMAESCIKWLTEITLREEEASGYYMQKAYRMPVTPIEPGSAPSRQPMLPVEEMVVKSLIAAPVDGDTVAKGSVMIQGVAWAGEAKVAKVEVSCDDGQTWAEARFVGEERPYAWRRWQFAWKAAALGPVFIRCRATDERGAMQPEASSWNPGGFMWNGWDRVSVMVGA